MVLAPHPARMRIGQYAEDSSVEPWAGVSTADGTVVKLPEVAEEAGIRLPRQVSDLLEEWRWQEKASLLVDRAEELDVARYDREALDVAAPVSDPQKVICVGLNYEDHAAEAGEDPPDQPVLFSKFPTAITGPGSTVEWDPDLTDEVDYEVELVVVIGREAREVPVDEARDYVAGYTVGNDVSARDIQMGDGQWVRGKSLDTFAPLGPELVTPDEVADPHDLDMWADLNGTRLQDSSTDNLIFDTDYLVSFCSDVMTLKPGDLIFTGTPAGVGVYHDPPELMDDGDSVTVGIEGLGELTNDCSYR